MKLNKKGFTLIELLAVIVVLGVLLLVAIPRISQYVAGARKDVVASTGKEYISAARYGIIQGDFATPSATGATVIKVSELKMEKGGTKSGFGATWVDDHHYVIVVDGGDDKQVYYYAMEDGAGNFVNPTTEDTLDGDSVNSGTKAITAFSAMSSDGTTEISGITGKFVTAKYPSGE